MEEKKFYWLKLKNDFFKRQDIRIVEDMPNGKDYILFYLKMLLESVEHNGELRFNDTIPYNEQMLATITNTNIDIVRSAMQVFTSLNMIEVWDNDTIYMSEVEKMIGSAVNNDNANRQRRFREKKKQEQLPEKTESVTKCNADVTPCVTEDNESIDIEKEKDIEIERELDKEKKPAKRTTFVKPTIEEIRAYITENGYSVDAERFYDYYEANGWYAGSRKMKDWKATVRNWDRRDKERVNTKFTNIKPMSDNPFDDKNL